MKSSRKLKAFFGMALALSVCCILSSVPANAEDIPTGIQLIRNEQGGAIQHDRDMVKFDKEGRDGVNDYNNYSRQRYGTNGNPVKNYASPNSDYMKATIDEIGTKGVYVNSIEVSPSEILSQDEINGVIGQYVGKNVFMSDIQEAINGINSFKREY